MSRPRDISRADPGLAGTRLSEPSPRPRLRILHLILVLGETNGQYNEHCLPLKDERDLSIVTYFTPQLTTPREITVYGGDGSPAGFFRALRRALDANSYDAIHAHAPHSGALLALALLIWRRFGRLRKSLVYTVQDSFQDYKLRNQVLMVMSLAFFYRVIFCSHAAYESLPPIWKRLVGTRQRVCQNAADIDRVDRALALADLTRADERFTIVSIGRLEKVKDPVTVLSAFRSLDDPNARLVYVGAGSLRADLERQIRAWGLDSQVELRGLVPRDQVFVECAKADLFVSASHGEGLPVTVIEAMASRCPVVLSDIPPHREVKDDADFVRIVGLSDVAGLSGEIRRARDMPRQERIEIGQRGRDHVLARFSLPIMHAACEAVYRELPTVSA